MQLLDNGASVNYIDQVVIDELRTLSPMKYDAIIVTIYNCLVLICMEYDSMGCPISIGHATKGAVRSSVSYLRRGSMST